MAFPEGLLVGDEEVAEHLHPHWVTLVPAVLAFLLTCAGVGVLVAVVPQGSVRGPLLVAVAAVAAVVLGRWVLRPLLRWRTTHYVLTTERVIVRSGVLSRTGQDIALSRIVTVRFHQSVRDRLVGAGTLLVESAGDLGVERLWDVPHARDVAALVSRLVDAGERRRHDSWR